VAHSDLREHNSGTRTSDPRFASRSVQHFTFPGTLPKCLPERGDKLPISIVGHAYRLSRSEPRCRKNTLV